MSIPFSFFGKNNDAVVKEREKYEQQATQQQKSMNTSQASHQAPVSGAASGYGATNDLAELAAVNGVTVLTTFANAHGQKDLEIKSDNTTNSIPKNH